MKTILIVMDTLRADHMSCYGYCRPTSPRVDELAAEGALFERCLTNTAHTMPTFTTIMTGQLPFTHGVVGTLFAHPDEPDQILGDTHPVLAQELRRAGTLTAGFDNLLDFGCVPKWFARGYDFYVNTLPKGRHCSQVLGEDINRRLIPWLKSYAQEDFFLFVHYWDTHQGYNQPDPWRSIHSKGTRPPRQLIDGRGYYPTWGWEDRLSTERTDYLDLYDGEISYADSLVGEIVDALRELDIYESTSLFFTGDHGEDMEEHNAPFEHREPYESACHVPLVVKPAAELGTRTGTRLTSLTPHIDIMPTILEIAATPAPAGLDGVSLLPIMRRETKAAHDHTFVHGGACKQHGVWISPELAVTDTQWKLIRRHPVRIDTSQPQADTVCLAAPPDRATNKDPMARVDYFNSLPQVELYNLATDPCETTDVSARQPDQVARLQKILDRYIASNPRRWGE